MNKLSLFAALPALAVAACNTPEGDDTADMAPDAVEADVSAEQAAGDGGAPELANVAAAIEEACPTLRNDVAEAVCEADNMGQQFTCEYRFSSDDEGTTREVTIARGDDGPDWDVQAEPDFCGSLDRAAMRAQSSSTTSDTETDTQAAE